MLTKPETGKMFNQKKMTMELTEKHIQKMKHALGNGSRNFYGVRKPDPDWEVLVEAKYATKRDFLGETVYHVTKEGKAALKRVIS